MSTAGSVTKSTCCDFRQQKIPGIVVTSNCILSTHDCLSWSPPDQSRCDCCGCELCDTMRSAVEAELERFSVSTIYSTPGWRWMTNAFFHELANCLRIVYIYVFHTQLGKWVNRCREWNGLSYDRIYGRGCRGVYRREGVMRLKTRLYVQFGEFINKFRNFI